MIERDPRLAAEPDLEPSSGFTASVMDAVRETAAEPPPLPFPWRRFVTGLCLSIAASAAVVAADLRGVALFTATADALSKLAIPLAYGMAGIMCALVTVRLTRLFT